jgi:hypothetical protein
MEEFLIIAILFTGFLSAFCARELLAGNKNKK